MFFIQEQATIQNLLPACCFLNVFVQKHQPYRKVISASTGQKWLDLRNDKGLEKIDILKL